MKVPFLDLKAINLQYRSELIQAATRVIDSGWYVQGEEVNAFEQEFSQYCRTKHCIGVANGLDALILTLRAWKELGKLKDGDVLIVPNVTPAVSVIGEVFVSTTYRFDEALTLQDYIEKAGGVREFADKSKVYIVRANGSVSIPESNYWFSANSGTALMPGDTIVVPRNVTNYDNISLWQGVTQILYQSAIALTAVRNL